jgi:hypothetical protein
MANERDEHSEEQEEGEYHFSDEEVNYDMEPETSSEIKTPTSGKGRLAEKLSKNRRPIIIGVIFLILIIVVYKMLIPAQTSVPPATAFNTNTPATTVTKPNLASENPPTLTTQATSVETPPIATAPIITTQPPTQPLATNPMVNTPTTSAPPTTTLPPPTPSTEQPPMENILNRLGTLEQQNTALTNLIQTDYAQKISDNETQNTSMHGKIEELNKRVNRIEASLSQIIQLLQNAGARSSNPSMQGSSGPFAKTAEPKTIYTVQAIIPGRAWLKSDNGDTVTVAEGDILKDYGRITKIDPYDGIVNIDTGRRIISLSYGVSAE